MKFAWIENNIVRDVCPGNPSECYTAEIAALYTTEVGDDICNGASLVNGAWVNPAPAAPTPEIPFARTWTAQEVRSALTLAERVKWDNDESNAVKTAKIEFQSAPALAHATEVLQMLVDSGDITQETMNKVLA